MENPAVGYRFRPNSVELVEYFLRTKNGDGDTSHVDRSISTVNICSFDPWKLPRQSVIQSSDQVWYFFGRIEKKYKRGGQQVRKTKSGSWKKTGKTIKILSRSGEEIGEKRVLVFHFNKSKTSWVMHEYHLSPLNPMMVYTICKVKFKGPASEIYSPPGGLSSGSEVGQSHYLIPFQGLSSESLPREESQYPEKKTQLDAMLWDINNLPEDDFEKRLDDDDFKKRLNDDEQSKIDSTQLDAILSDLINLPDDDFKKMLNDDYFKNLNDHEQSKIVSMQQDCSGLD